MSYKLVRSIDVKNYGTGHLRTGDLNGDGLPELLLTQAWPMNREVCCLTAIDLDGKVLWQYGAPVENGAHGYSDLPVQIYDWDGDGKNEVLFLAQAYYKVADMWRYSTGSRVIKEIHDRSEVRADPDLASERAIEYAGQAFLVILDGATGTEKYRYEVPISADDCIAIGHFDGTGKANALVKDRYWNMWAIGNDGQELWSLPNSALKQDWKYPIDLGHFPGVGDIDGDGLDEVFISNTLVDSDGTVLWQLDGMMGHSDVCVVLEDAPERRIITCADHVRCIRPDGTVAWAYPGGHLQNVYPGKFSDDPADGPYQFLVRDIMPAFTNYEDAVEGYNMGNAKGQTLSMYNWDGKLMWKLTDPEVTSCRVIRWTGHRDCLIHYLTEKDETGAYPCVIRNGRGEVVDTVYFMGTDGKVNPDIMLKETAYAADLLGDSRDELVLYTPDTISIYCNTAPYNQRRHYNFTHYNGE